MKENKSQVGCQPSRRLFLLCSKAQVTPSWGDDDIGKEYYQETEIEMVRQNGNGKMG
jgi:hypothetical protein